ncbi:MAG: hypothetical protein QE487_15710 [Fluviicola sp.]|nr:hypothetical protein [Fluviicola sp.]
METSVEQLIKDKTFDSLTSDELVVVQELCESEEEFLSMKQFFQELEGVSMTQQTVVNPEIKSSLDSIFGAKHPGIRANWTAPEAIVAAEPIIIPLYQRTWFRIAAILVIVLGTIPFWNLVQTDHESLPQLKTAKVDGASIGREQAPLEKFVSNEGTGKETIAAVTKQQVTTPTKAVLVASLNDDMKDYAVRMDDVPASGEIADYRTISEPVFSAAASSPAPAMLFSAGRDADLHPFDGIRTRANALSLAEEPEDLLDLLVPAF